MSSEGSVNEALSFLSRNIIFSHIQICLLKSTACSFSIINNSFSQWKGLRKNSSLKSFAVHQTSVQSRFTEAPQCSPHRERFLDRFFSRSCYQRMLLHCCLKSCTKTPPGQASAALRCIMFSIMYSICRCT